jgi:pantothenate kinase
MNLINKENNYNTDYLFNIVYADIEISSILNKDIPSIRKNPKLLSKKTKTQTIERTVQLLDQNNLYPNKDIHDRKLSTYIPKHDNKKTYWISKVLIHKQISKTKTI